MSDDRFSYSSYRIIMQTLTFSRVSVIMEYVAGTIVYAVFTVSAKYIHTTGEQIKMETLVFVHMTSSENS